MGSSEEKISIGSLESASDSDAFHRINEEWLLQFFSLTDQDRKALGDPEGTIIARGGDLLVARTDNGIAVGVVALSPHANKIFELTKMGVTAQMQGKGVGSKLLVAALARARELGARRLFLGTNTQLASAIHLYERAGFAHITRAELPVEDYYARANVFMELVLE